MHFILLERYKREKVEKEEERRGEVRRGEEGGVGVPRHMNTQGDTSAHPSLAGGRRISSSPPLLITRERDEEEGEKDEEEVEVEKPEYAKRMVE